MVKKIKELALLHAFLTHSKARTAEEVNVHHVLFKSGLTRTQIKYIFIYCLSRIGFSIESICAIARCGTQTAYKGIRDTEENVNEWGEYIDYIYELVNFQE